MKLAFIGSGNLATRLALAFRSAGVQVIQVYSRSVEHARQLAEKLGCDYTDKIFDLSSEADVIISAIKDSVCEEVWSKAPFKNRLVLHTAGSLPMSVLKQYSENYGVLYPLQTLSKEKDVDFFNVPLFIEASDSHNLSVVKSLAEKISGSITVADSEQRKSLHISAVFACNFVNHCYAIAADLLKKNGLPFCLLLPLIEETADKVRHLAPVDAQTGPAVRYDKNVIDSHIKFLGEDSREAEIYRLISRSVNEYSKK